jgi:hypothetical protein
VNRPSLIGLGLMVQVAGAAAQQAPRLTVNHLYFVVDSATWHDINASPFLHEQFSAAENRRTSSGELQWTGTYLYGRHVYLEFLGPGSLPGAQVGDVGIGLGVEHAGDLGQVIQRYTGWRYPFDTLTRMRVRDADTLPWFLAWRPGGEDALSDRTAFWVMEYTRAMAERAGLRDSLPASDRSRSRFLPMPWDSTRILRDVEGADIALPPEDIARIRLAIQRLGGATVAAEGEGAVIDLFGFRLHLLPAFGRPGVRRISFGLVRGVVANPTFRFGLRSKLKFGPGAAAVWDF